ncbi:MAG: type II secretion system protein [Candidatus Neomarinimicrobiota bacterium]
MKKNNSSIKNNNGYTLIELIVTIVLSGIVAVIIAVTLMSGVRGLDHIFSQRRLVQEGELGLTKFTREVTLINTVYIASATHFSFSTNQFPGVTIEYKLVGGEGLVRIYSAGSGTNKRMVANINVGSSSFSYFDINGSPTAVIADIHLVRLTLAMEHLGESTILTADVFPVVTRFES